MISQTIEYALRAMTYLASLAPGQAASSEVIADSAKMPQGYLSKVLRGLVVAELVSSQRGPNGGFALARPASAITLLEVVNAVDPMQRIKSCPLGNPAHLKLCPLHRRIDEAMDVIERQFAGTTLAEVLAESAQGGERCRSLNAAPPAVKLGRS